MAGNGSGSGGRSAQEKEKTKLRERQRRSITTKIFHGLRKHGGYRLSSRADINEVLRELAKEAGWIVEPDGTTYRSSSSALLNAPDLCPLCGTGKSGTPTPASSVVICGEADCSTAASPRPVTVADPMVGIAGTSSLYNHGGPSTPFYGGDGENPLAIYMYQRLASGFIPPSSAASGGGNPPAVTAGYQQLMCFQEARASNQNTPAASPRRR